ncbi:MAG: hypothetical protein JJT85_07125 [Chromatiales bacterium]|nr:hypothetical protein [Chromatiales bacterium]
MQVFQPWSDQHPETSIDIFVSTPFDFDEEYERALVKELAPGRPVCFVSMPTLIRMKEQAGRQQDLVDNENPRLRIRDGE